MGERHGYLTELKFFNFGPRDELWSPIVDMVVAGEIGSMDPGTDADEERARTVAQKAIDELSALHDGTFDYDLMDWFPPGATLPAEPTTERPLRHYVDLITAVIKEWGLTAICQNPLPVLIAEHYASHDLTLAENSGLRDVYKGQQDLNAFANRLRDEVGSFLIALHIAASDPNRRGADIFKQYLSQVLAACVPTNRGNRPRHPTEYGVLDIATDYCDYLLRWSQASPSHDRERWPDAKPNDPVADVSQFYELDRDEVEDFRGRMRAHTQSPMKSENEIRRFASTSTARKYEITSKRLWHILSDLRRNSRAE